MKTWRDLPPVAKNTGRPLVCFGCGISLGGHASSPAEKTPMGSHVHANMDCRRQAITKHLKERGVLPMA